MTPIDSIVEWRDIDGATVIVRHGDTRCPWPLSLLALFRCAHCRRLWCACGGAGESEWCDECEAAR